MNDIKYKLMFFLWDSVFSRDKTPLEKLLDIKLRTFGDFTAKAQIFVDKILNIYNKTEDKKK